MQDKEAKKAAANSLVKEVIEDTTGLKFIKFEPFHVLKRMPSRETQPDKWRVISVTSLKESSEVSNWIIDILKAEGIHNEFLLMWHDRKISGYDWAKVSLSPNYEWVKPIWERARELYFMPLDKRCLWEIYGMEGKYHATCVELNAE